MNEIKGNGLSLKEVQLGIHLMGKQLFLNDEIIPGQCGIILGNKDKWGVRSVQVFFEVYDGEDDE